MAAPTSAGPRDELFTVLDLVRYAATRFGEAGLVFGHGTDNAADEAVFLIGEALRLPTERIDAFLPARLTTAERQKLLDLVDTRIATRKPAAYLLRRAYMRGVPFYVDERVVVPRSHIGEVLDSDLIGGEGFALIGEPDSVRTVLDLCTGSGCLAILACRAFPNAEVDAVDISADALAVAEKNVADHGLGDRIALRQGDLFAPLGAARYDLILTNPPYVAEEGMASLPAEYRHEPPLALAGGADGLSIIRRILAEAGPHLTESGGLLCEIGGARSALEGSYPETEFFWIDTQAGAGEVFWLDAAALRAAALR